FGRRAPRTALWRPGSDQGQHRHGGPDVDHGRLARTPRLEAGARCLHRAPAARRRRADPRQDHPERVGQLPITTLLFRVERARRVAVAAALLSVLAGYDPDDPATAPLRERPPPDYSRFLDAAGLKGARIGVMRHFAGFHEEVDALFERALAALRSGGAVLVDPADIAIADKLYAYKQSVMAYVFQYGINRYLATRVGGG